MENKNFMTVDEVAQELNVSKLCLQGCQRAECGNAEAWLSDSYRKSEYQLLSQEVMLQRIERR